MEFPNKTTTDKPRPIQTRISEKTPLTIPEYSIAHLTSSKELADKDQPEQAFPDNFLHRQSTEGESLSERQDCVITEDEPLNGHQRRFNDNHKSPSDGAVSTESGTSFDDGTSAQRRSCRSEEEKFQNQTSQFSQEQTPAERGAANVHRTPIDSKLRLMTDSLTPLADNSSKCLTDNQRHFTDDTQMPSTEIQGSPTDKQRPMADKNHTDSRGPLPDSYSFLGDTQKSPADDSHRYPTDKLRVQSDTSRIQAEVTKPVAEDQKQESDHKQSPMADNWTSLADNSQRSPADNTRPVTDRPVPLVDGKRQTFPQGGNTDAHRPKDGAQAYSGVRGNGDEHEEPGSGKASTPDSGWPEELEGRVILFGVPIVTLYVERQERLCLAQISTTLLHEFSYNEIHNRRVALGITCLQCTPSQLEVLRRAGAMPVTSRRCGLITKREAERLVRSFIADCPPPRLPDNVTFRVRHKCGWGNEGVFVPARYNSSRAKCIRCLSCGVYFSPNKFIFHCHPVPNSNAQDYRHPDAANFNSWRRHLELVKPDDKEDRLTHAWEDVKSMFNGGCRKRFSSLSSLTSSSAAAAAASLSCSVSGSSSTSSLSSSFSSSAAALSSAGAPGSLSLSSMPSPNALFSSPLSLSLSSGRNLSYEASSAGCSRPSSSGGGGGGGVYRANQTPSSSHATPGAMSHLHPITTTTTNNNNNASDNNNNNNDNSGLVPRSCPEAPSTSRKHLVNVPNLITATTPHMTSFPPGLGPASAATLPAGLLPHLHHPPLPPPPNLPPPPPPPPPISANAHPAFFAAAAAAAAASGLQAPVLSYGDYLRSMSRPYNVVPPSTSSGGVSTSLPVVPASSDSLGLPPAPPAVPPGAGFLHDLYRSQQHAAGLIPPGIVFGAAAAAAAAACPYPVSYFGYRPYYAAAIQDPAGGHGGGGGSGNPASVAPHHHQQHHHHHLQAPHPLLTHHPHHHHHQLTSLAEGGRLSTTTTQAAQLGAGGSLRPGENHYHEGTEAWSRERKASPREDRPDAVPGNEEVEENDDEDEEEAVDDKEEEEECDAQEHPEGDEEEEEKEKNGRKTPLTEEQGRMGFLALDEAGEDLTSVISQHGVDQNLQSEDVQQDQTAVGTDVTTAPTSCAEERPDDEVDEARDKRMKPARGGERDSGSEMRDDDSGKAKNDNVGDDVLRNSPGGVAVDEAEVQEHRRKASLLPNDIETLLTVFEDFQDVDTFIHLPLDTIRLLFKLSKRKSKSANKELRKIKELHRLQRQRAEEVREELSRQYFAIKESIWTKIQQEREMKAVLQERLAEIQKLTPQALDPSFMFANMK